MTQIIQRRFRGAARIGSVAISAVLYGVGTSAHASELPEPLLFMDWSSDASGQRTYFIHNDSEHGWQDGSEWVYEGSDSHENWDMNWRIAGTVQSAAAGSKADYFVNVNLAVTNKTDSFQTFSALISFILPEELNGGAVMDGSAVVSVTDVFGDGAEIRTVNGQPIYQAFIDDDLTAQTLFDSDYSLIAPSGGGASDSMTFGDRAPIDGPATIQSITVLIEFELSPHDTANVVGTLRVAQLIPAPSALPMLAGFMLAFHSRRRRN